MDSSLSHGILTSEQLDLRISTLGEEKWRYIQKIVRIKTDRIILPGFPHGIKWSSEVSKFGLETAREKFSQKLMKVSQMEELLSHLHIFEHFIPGITLSVFSNLLVMRANISQSYLIEGNTTFKTRLGISEKKPAELFMDKNGEMIYQKIQNIVGEYRKAFKIRLQAD